MQMPIRSTKYPLDVSTRYPESVISSVPRVRARDRISGLVVHPETDDLTNEVLYKSIMTVWRNSHTILAYCDVIDLAQETAANAQKNADTRIATLDQRLTGVMGEVASLRTSIDTLIAFFGVTVPAWINKEEVENGDDMGIVHPSAVELGILVAFEFVQQQPGFGHEDVVSIDPPAGTLIARGTTVTVTLNLLG
jgi:hypothetical protein